MNLLLHGLDYPQIDPGNSLRKPLKDIGDNDRVDIIITNPPFGGEEEKGILNNFPDDKRTSETAFLFLQLIMRKLRRKKAGKKSGRAAVIVPNGILFADGVADRIKLQLLEDFNLHTVIRLGDGVFAPYTNIPSNLLFFEHGGPTKDVWYYEVPVANGRKKYSKTKAIQTQEFDAVKQWWKKRKADDNAWKVKAKDIIKTDENGKVTVNLDIKNPNRKGGMEYRDPVELMVVISDREKKISKLIQQMNKAIAKSNNL